MWSFILVLRNRQPLLGIPDTEILGILTINCNSIEEEEAYSHENCKTNMSQEIDATEEYYTNTDSILKSGDEDKPTVTDNDNNNNIKYSLPGATVIMTKGQVLKSHSNYKGSSKMYLMV